MNKKSLWKYMCECNWTFPIAGSIFVLACAYCSGDWVEFLVALPGVWLFFAHYDLFACKT